MAADSSATTTTAVQDDEAVVKTATMPLPRAIQLVMAISSRLNPSSTTTSTETIEEHGVDLIFVFLKLVFLPSMFIAPAAIGTYTFLHDDDDEVISGGGGFVFLAVQALPQVYFAVVLAAGGHLDLFAPQAPYAAWEALYKVGFKGMGFPVIFIPFGASMLYLLMPDQAWLLLLACAYLLGLLVAATIALWLCLLRTYDGGGKRREMSCGEAVIEGLAYLYSRLLYEIADRFLADEDARHAAAA